MCKSREVVIGSNGLINSLERLYNIVENIQITVIGNNTVLFYSGIRYSEIRFVACNPIIALPQVRPIGIIEIIIVHRTGRSARTVIVVPTVKIGSKDGYVLLLMKYFYFFTFRWVFDHLVRITATGTILEIKSHIIVIGRCSFGTILHETIGIETVIKQMIGNHIAQLCVRHVIDRAVTMTSKILLECFVIGSKNRCETFPAYQIFITHFLNSSQEVGEIASTFQIIPRISHRNRCCMTIIVVILVHFITGKEE